MNAIYVGIQKKRLIMAVYAVDKLIEETRRLAAQFRLTTGTMLPVSAEIARYDVSHHLNLELINNNCSYDAIGRKERDGLHIQIKSRVIGDSVKPGHRIGKLNPDADWDMTILSLMDNNFEPQEMYEATHAEIIETLSKSKSNRSKRGVISVAKFMIISQLVWTKELGTKIN